MGDAFWKGGRGNREDVSLKVEIEWRGEREGKIKIAEQGGLIERK